MQVNNIFTSFFVDYLNNIDNQLIIDYVLNLKSDNKGKNESNKIGWRVKI